MYSSCRSACKQTYANLLRFISFNFRTLGFDEQWSDKVETNIRKRRIFEYSFVRQIVRWLRAVRHYTLHITHFRIISSRLLVHVAPRNVPLLLSGVSRMCWALCWTDSCDCFISSWTNSWLASNRVSFLEFSGNGELFNRPLHRITPSYSYNPNCVTYVGGVDLWSLR